MTPISPSIDLHIHSGRSEFPAPKSSLYVGSKINLISEYSTDYRNDANLGLLQMCK